MKKFNQLVLILPFVLLCGTDIHSQINSTKSDPAIRQYFDIVRNTFKGKQSFQVTGYVEQYFRLPGNSGFNKSINHVVSHLKKVGYKLETEAKPYDRLIYRVEKRAMIGKAWEPIDASLYVEGEKTPLLSFSTNRNMIAINSFPTPKEGINADVVYLPDIQSLEKETVKDKIVFSDKINSAQLFEKAVREKGAIGILVYRMSAITKPQQNVNLIQFGRIPQDENRKSFCIFMSFQAKERLKKAIQVGKTKINIFIETKLYQSEELTLIAEIRGSSNPNERFVFSAHVQEPGANDNASGVGCLTEIATAAALLIKLGKINPKRTLTFLWGDEFISTRRYIQDDAERAKAILWGMSLDMVGEDINKTGGTFLIEKMPDPSAIWTRGNDKHSEWGDKVLADSNLFPHYFNDFVINRFSEQGKFANWTVNTNPYEGGSDHTPFVNARIPGVLAWHFTDMFYHTDGDRMENVSQATLRNVGIAALVIALTLTSADETITRAIIDEVEEAAKRRLTTELALSKQMLSEGKSKVEELKILETWGKWYVTALQSTLEIPVEDASLQLKNYVQESTNRIKDLVNEYINQLEKM